MAERETKYLQTLESLDAIVEERDKLSELCNEIKDVRTEVQNRVLSYIKNNAKNLPNFYSTKEILDTLASLFKAELDIHDRIIRSHEKTIEITAKYVPHSEDGETPYELNFEKLSELRRMVFAGIDEDDSNN